MWSIANTIQARPVAWLWQGRIPLGKITLLDGDPGLGKSLLTIDLAARVTTGRAMPDESPGVSGGAGVVLLSAEDDPADTIVPRLRVAAADTGRVALFHDAAARNPETGQELPLAFVLPRDIPELERATQEIAARLVVIDPLMAFLDNTVNTWRDHDVRAALTPLAEMAQRTGAAILILRHLNKATGMSAIHRGGGSIGIIGAARSGLLVAKHPENPESERVLAIIKGNLSAPAPALRYQLVTPLQDIEGLVEEGEEYLRDAPMVEWLGTCAFTANQLLAPLVSREADTPTKVEEAMDWLREALVGGPVPMKTLEAGAEAAGIKSRTLRTASERLHLSRERVGFEAGSYWRWRLPADGTLAETP